MTLSSLKVRGVVAIANVPFEADGFSLDEKDIQDLCTGCPEKLPLNLNHEDAWVVGSGKLSTGDNGRELVFTGTVDCGYFLNALQQSKDSYYRNAALYRPNYRLKETIEEYLAVQQGQLSLCHNHIDMTPKHVSLVHLGQRIGAQGFFSPSKAPLKWRKENQGIVNKMLSLAYLQRHLSAVRSEKLLKDSQFVGSVGVLVNASHKTNHRQQHPANKPTSMAQTTSILQRLLRDVEQQQQQPGKTKPDTAESNKRTLDATEADDNKPQAKALKLEKRVGDLETILSTMLESYEQQTEEQSIQEETPQSVQQEAAATPEQTFQEEHQPAAEQQQQQQQQSLNDPRVDSIVSILDRLSNNMDKLQQQQEILANFNSRPTPQQPVQQQPPVKVVSVPSRPSVHHSAGIAAVAETQKKIAAESKLVNANFTAPSTTNVETMKLARYLPNNNPVASQLLKSFATKVSTLSVNQKERLKTIMDFK